MTVKAIFEAGVLRPLTPLDLAEGQEVDISVPALLEHKKPDPQRAAEIMTAIAAMPLESHGEPFSGEDHDRVLYGEKGAR